MNTMVDTVIVGAGIAGLVAARDLVRSGQDVLVLEARDRVGGRLLNGELPDGSPIEVGGQWVGPTQYKAMALVDELGLETYRSYAEGRNIIELGSVRKTYTGRIPKLNPAVLADIGQIQARLDRLGRRVAEAGDPWQVARAEEIDSRTFATQLDKMSYTSAGRAFFNVITEAVFSAGPEDMSALWAAHYIGAAGGIDALINVENGAQQDRISGGSQRIALALAEELGDRVVLDSPVSEIDWADDEVRVTAGGSTIRARRAVIAIPPPLAARIKYSPGLPSDRDQLVQRMPMGRVIKVNVAYEEPFWRS